MMVQSVFFFLAAAAGSTFFTLTSGAGCLPLFAPFRDGTVGGADRG